MRYLDGSSWWASAVEGIGWKEPEAGPSADTPSKSPSSVPPVQNSKARLSSHHRQHPRRSIWSGATPDPSQLY